MVGYDDNLLNELIYEKLCLNSLWGDVFAIRSLEEILDALCDVQFAILQVASISCAEISVFGKCLLVEMITLVIALCYSWTFEQNLVILTNLYVDAFDRPSDRTDAERLVAMVA